MNKSYLVIASSSILLSSCGSATESITPQQQSTLSSFHKQPFLSNSIHEVVNNYIETLFKQPESGGGKYRCVQDLAKDRFNRILNIQEWQITGTSLHVDKDDPDSISTDVYVKITRDLNGEKITNTWIASAWKTSDLLETRLRSNEKLTELLKSSQETIKRSNEITNALTGKTTSTETTSRETIPITIDKSAYASETFCVTGIFKAYK
ncbi:MAG: hypothetical protein LH613_07910 [Chamaesiphon sp.]|nr:hypothetical protein [Chamaesiphon sp.]